MPPAFLSRLSPAALPLLLAVTAATAWGQSPNPATPDPHGPPRTAEESPRPPVRPPSMNNAPERPLAQYRDKSRVLLVFAPTAQDAAYLEQNKLWKNEKADLDERQLVVVPVLADARAVDGAAGAAPAALARKYGVDAKGFAVVLVGKDGHDAYHATKPLRPETLYGVVDAMPMRRAEVKRQQAASPTPAPTPKRPDLDHDE